MPVSCIPEVQITLALESFPDMILNSMRVFLFDDTDLVMLSSVTSVDQLLNKILLNTEWGKMWF